MSHTTQLFTSWKPAPGWGSLLPASSPLLYWAGGQDGVKYPPACSLWLSWLWRELSQLPGKINPILAERRTNAFVWPPIAYVSVSFMDLSWPVFHISTKQNVYVFCKLDDSYSFAGKIQLFYSPHFFQFFQLTLFIMGPIHPFPVTSNYFGLWKVC